tara:strand:- start:846 stop:2504 length:1659 start_codon:yes stop_codon:yes gene_type:complete
MKDNKIIYFCLFFLVICWLYIWGKCANPFQVSCFSYPGWGDHLQSYSGWISYAKEQNLPLFSRSFSSWTWPITSELVFADTIPVLSIILKPIYNLLQLDFHYFSVVSFINIFATFFCGLIIGNFFKLQIRLSSLLGLLLALSPVALIRIPGHESLSLHFFIVYPMTLLITKSLNRFKWSVLIFISLGIHAYYMPMILLLMLANSFSRITNLHISRLTKSREIFIDFLIAIFSIFLGLKFFGYLGNTFIPNKNDDLWSANLLSLIDPQDTSIVFDRLSILRPYQWEGYSYLGILFITLLTISSIIIIRKSLDYRSFITTHLHYFIILALFLFIALGSPIYLGDKSISNNPILIDQLFINTFRATGRFMWPIYYSLIISSYVILAKSINFRPRLINVFSISILLFMIESHFFTIYNLRTQMNYHFNEGYIFNKGIYNDKISHLIRDNDYFINATGIPYYLSPSIPPLMPQSVNPSIKSNYFPRFARENKMFNYFFSQNSCDILNNIYNQKDENNLANSLILIDDSEVEMCDNFVFNKRLDLPNERFSIYSITSK